jgi:hypothetical protein
LDFPANFSRYEKKVKLNDARFAEFDEQIVIVGIEVDKKVLADFR